MLSTLLLGSNLYGVPFVPKLSWHATCLCFVSSSMSMCLLTVYVCLSMLCVLFHVYVFINFLCLCLSVYARCRLPCLCVCLLFMSMSVCLCYVLSSMSMCLLTVYVYVIAHMTQLLSVSTQPTPSVCPCCLTVSSCCVNDACVMTMCCFTHWHIY